MIRLDSTLRKLEIVLAGAVATTQPSFVASWSDASATGYLGGTNPGSANGATAVTLVDAPGSGLVRDVDYLAVMNRDTAPVTLTIRYNDNATLLPIITVALPAGSQLTYTHGNGWQVLDSAGRLQSNISAAVHNPVFSGLLTTEQQINVTAAYGSLLVGGVEVQRFGGASGDNSGQLAGFRNILINPRISAGINQRGVANWAAVANGAYGYDRWKKVDASTITQIVEVGNFTPSAVYTYAGNTFSPIQITSPASGNWTLPAISKLETDAQLEEGYIASKHEVRLNEVELLLCRRYLRGVPALNSYASGMVGAGGTEGSLICPLALGMRANPALVSTDAGPSIIVGSLSGYISTLVIGNSGSSAYTIASGVGTAGQSCVVRSNSVTFLSAEL